MTFVGDDGEEYTDAILAAFAEELAVRHDLERPRWTRAVGPLPEGWSPPATPRMRAPPLPRQM